MELEKLKELLFSGEEKNIKLALENGKESAEFQDLVKNINKFVDWMNEAHYEPTSFMNLLTNKALNVSENLQTQNDDIPKEIIFLQHLKEFDLNQYWFQEEYELEWGDEDYPIGVADEGYLLTFPDGMENLKNLEVLDLSTNHLEAFPNWVFKLPKLKELRMQTIYVDSIPSDIGDLSSLEILDVSYSPNLNEIPDEIGKLKMLKVLNLENTPISEETHGDKLNALLPNTEIKYYPL